jgi:hypothetical protein
MDIHKVLDSGGKPVKDSKSGGVEATTARGAAAVLVVRSGQVIHMLVTVVLEGRKNGLKGFISIVELLVCRDPLSVCPALVADSPLLR